VCFFVIGLPWITIRKHAGLDSDAHLSSVCLLAWMVWQGIVDWKEERRWRRILMAAGYSDPPPPTYPRSIPLLALAIAFSSGWAFWVVKHLDTIDTFIILMTIRICLASACWLA
jgi:hypothetical protein